MTTYPLVRPISEKVLARVNDKMPVIRVGGYAVGIGIDLPKQNVYFTNIIKECRGFLRSIGQSVESVELTDRDIIDTILLSEWRLDEEVRLDEIMLLSMVMTGHMTVEEHIARKFTIGEVAYAAARARAEIIGTLVKKSPVSQSPLTEHSNLSQDSRFDSPGYWGYDINRSSGFDTSGFWGDSARETQIVTAIREKALANSTLFWLWAARYMYDYQFQMVDRAFAAFSSSQEFARLSFVSQTIASDVARFSNTGLEFYQLAPYLTNGIRDEDTIVAAVAAGDNIDFEILRAMSSGGAA